VKTLPNILRFFAGVALFYLFFVYVFPVLLKILVPLFLFFIVVIGAYFLYWYFRLSLLKSEAEKQFQQAKAFKHWPKSATAKIFTRRNKQQAADEIIDAEFRRID